MASGKERSVKDHLCSKLHKSKGENAAEWVAASKGTIIAPGMDI